MFLLFEAWETVCRASQSPDRESLIVECIVNGTSFTGPARYAINAMVDPKSIPGMYVSNTAMTLI